MNFTVAQIMDLIGPLSGYLHSFLIILVTLIVIKIAFSFINSLKKKVSSGKKTNLYETILNAIKRPLGLGILLFGIFFSLKSLPPIQAFADNINTFFTIIFSFYFAYLASKVIGLIIEWYSTEIAEKTETKVDDQFLPILKRATYGIIFGIMIILMLNQLGIRVETLIATLGIGGLAVALALQPTLSNFFSGMQMVFDRPLRIGDFVELDSGDKGTVVDIGWRSTRIRTYMNNIVTIPNSKLSDSRVINYTTPTSEIGFAVECGVTYDSDLEHVEKIGLEVAKDVLERCNGVKNFKPIFRYREFGDSSINFKVVLRTKTLGDSYLATHEFIKKLKKSFEKEGIEIAFPQLDIHLDKLEMRKVKRKAVSKTK